MLQRLPSRVSGESLPVSSEAAWRRPFEQLLRMWRRPGAFDGRPSNVLAAACGAPRRDRPARDIAPGLSYYPHHTGFDHRRLRHQLAERFEVDREVCSPVPWLGAALNSEIVFLARRRAA